METPDITKAQGGALGVFAATVLAAPHAGYHGIELVAVVATTGVVCAAGVIADAMIRKGRSRILADEMKGLQANLALVGHYTDTPAEDGDE